MSINLELEKKILNLIKSFNEKLFDEVIKDASDFIFNLRDPDETLRAAGES